MKFCILLWQSALLVGLTGIAVGVRADGPIPDLPTITRTLSLRDALTLAQTGNVMIQQARADADTASAESRSAQAQQRPSVSATTYGTIGDSTNILNTSPGVTPQNLFAVPSHGFADQNLMVMVPLLTGGRLDGMIASARNLNAAAQLSIQATHLKIDDSVTEGYANTILQQSLVNVAEAWVTAEDEQVKVTEERVNTGRSAPVELLREQAEQADAQQALLAAQNNAALANVNLKASLGLSQSSQITLSDTLDSLATQGDLPNSLTAALSLADSHRPELAAADAHIAAAKAGVHSAAGAYSPQLYGVAMGDASAGHGLDRVGYTVGLTASVSLFDGGQRRADVDAAKARVERAQADAAQIHQQVEQETASAWLTWQTATAQVQVASVHVTAAQQGYDLANLRYNAGKSTTVERLDALSALVRAQGALAQAKADVISARARLLAAVGRIG